MVVGDKKRGRGGGTHVCLHQGEVANTQNRWRRRI